MKKLLFLAVLGMLTMLVAAPAFAQSGADGSFNCEDFEFQEDAQDFFDQDTSDPDGLDGPPGEAFTGEPGVACEELPSRGDMEEPMMEEPTPDPSQPGIQPGTAEACEGIIDQAEFEECAGQYAEPPIPAPVPEPAPTTETVLPDTGGPSLALLAGGLLIGAGLVMRRR